MKDERGFILPIVAVLAFLFTAVILHQVALLESERRFLLERKNFFLHDCQLQAASSELFSIFEKLDTIEKEKGQLGYESGTVNYVVLENNEAITTIQLTSTTSLSGKREAFFTIDKEKNRIIKWSES